GTSRADQRGRPWPPTGKRRPPWYGAGAAVVRPPWRRVVRPRSRIAGRFEGIVKKDFERRGRRGGRPRRRRAVRKRAAPAAGTARGRRGRCPGPPEARRTGRRP